MSNNKEKLKIAMIGHKRIPFKEGGVEVVVEELSIRMATYGHQIDVYNRYKRGMRVGRTYKGVNIITIPTINTIKLEAFVYSILASIRVLFGNYDVIHYHAEGPCAMIWLPRLFGKKTIATIHGLDWQRSKWNGFATKYLKCGEKMAVRYANEIIVLAQNHEKYFQDVYGRKTHYIGNGVNEVTKREPKIIKEEYKLNTDDYLLFLARIVPEKGLHYLLEAFRKIKTDKKLVIAGSVNYRTSYGRKINQLSDKDERVILTDFVVGREKEELFSNCYMYILPSDIEGMPVSLLEAMRYGCRCLVSDIPENRALITNPNNLFKKSNINDLKKQIENLLASKKLEKRDYNMEEFSWDNIVESTIKLYKQII